MAKPAFLPIIQVDRARARGFAGLISDTSLLDVVTFVAKNPQGEPFFRAGTVAIIVDSNPKTGTLRGTVATDNAAAKGKRLVAVSFSHDGAVEYGDVGNIGTVTGAFRAPKPVNGVEVGRIWLFVDGDVAHGDKVVIAAARTTPAGKELSGWVKKGTADTIPGWEFTGLTEVDPATGEKIAEVTVNRVRA